MKTLLKLKGEPNKISRVDENRLKGGFAPVETKKKSTEGIKNIHGCENSNCPKVAKNRGKCTNHNCRSCDCN